MLFQLTYKLKRNHGNYSQNKIFLKTLRKPDANDVLSSKELKLPRMITSTR